MREGSKEYWKEMERLAQFLANYKGSVTISGLRYGKHWIFMRAKQIVEEREKEEKEQSKN